MEIGTRKHSVVSVFIQPIRIFSTDLFSDWLKLKGKKQNKRFRVPPRSGKHTYSTLGELQF